MGMFGYAREGKILHQMKKAQGETNERLDRIIALLAAAAGERPASADEPSTATAGPSYRR